MKYLFYSDPHLGLRRQANSTRASSETREQKALSTLLGKLDETPNDGVVCAGDLFDQCQNPEQVIKQGAGLLWKTDFVLAGNHDMANREGVVGSLQLLDTWYRDKVIINKPGDYEAHEAQLDMVRLSFVPHAISQELFEKGLDDAVSAVQDCQTWRILVLHCNYSLGFENVPETSLNLTEERLTELLGHFHFVLSGHEHTARDLLDGRFKIIGSTFPTAFDNLDRKRMLLFDTDTGQFEDIELWSPEKSVWKGVYTEFSDTFGAAADFYHITDDGDPGEAQKLAVSLFKRGALGVRLVSPEGNEEPVEMKTVDLSKLPEQIAADISANHKSLLPLWEECKNAVSNSSAELR